VSSTISSSRFLRPSSRSVARRGPAPSPCIPRCCSRSFRWLAPWCPH
jgi:hypothetical protein